MDRKRQLHRKFADYYSRSFGFARIKLEQLPIVSVMVQLYSNSTVVSVTLQLYSKLPVIIITVTKVLKGLKILVVTVASLVKVFLWDPLLWGKNSLLLMTYINQRS